MSSNDDQELEKFIKEIFFKAKRKSITSQKVRVRSIVKRGLYETGFKDLLLFCSQILTAMLMMTSLILKTLSMNNK